MKQKILKITFFITTFIIFTSFLFLNTVSSSTVSFDSLVYTLGEQITNDDLAVEGYSIYSSNINNNAIGSYEVVYQNIATPTTKKTRKVSIVSKDYFEVDESSSSFVTFTGVYDIKRVYDETGTNYYNLILSYQNTNYFVYVEYYNHDYLAFQKKLLIRYIDSYYASDACKILCYIEGNVTVLSLDKYQTMSQTTLSYSIPYYCHYEASLDTLCLCYMNRIIELKESTLEELRILYTSSFKDQIDTSATYIFFQTFYDTDAYYYVYQNKNRSNELLVFVLENNLYCQESRKIDDLKYDNMYYQKQSFLFNFELSSDEVDLMFDYCVLNEETNTHHYQIISFDKPIEDIRIHSMNDFVYLSLTDTNGKLYTYQIYGPFMNETLFKGNRIYSDNLYYYSLGTKIEIGTPSIMTCFYESESTTIKDETIPEQEVEMTLEKLYLFMNGKNVETIENYDYDTFGTFNGVLEEKIDHYQVHLSYQYQVNDSLNLKDKETYQVGTVVYFLGTGLLNENKIESGTALDKEGSYYLELNGNDTKKVISFTVKDLNQSVLPVEEARNNITNNTIQEVATNSLSKINYEKENESSTINLEETLDIVNNYQEGLSDSNYIVMILILCIIIIFFVSHYYKKNNKLKDKQLHQKEKKA